MRARTLIVGASVLLAGLGLAIESARIVAVVRAPPVHDVATDWRDPLTASLGLVRLRGARANPIEPAPLLVEGPRGGFLGRPIAEINARSCSGAKPLSLGLKALKAYERARAALIGSGLALVTDEPAEGRLEATTAPSAGADGTDVLVRVRADGAGSRVDLRSISRRGLGDAGANCMRVLKLRRAIARVDFGWRPSLSS